MTDNGPASDATLPYGDGDASFRAAGGREGITRLVDDFYRVMERDPRARTIRAMHPQDLSESREKLMRFLCGWLGGPKLYREKYGPIHIPRAHRHLDIDYAERDAWLSCMEQALAMQPYREDFKRYLLKAFFKPADACRHYNDEEETH